MLPVARHLTLLLMAMPLSFMAPSATTQEPAAPPPLQRSVVYVCPMHPEVQSQVPGKCSKCQMTLVASAEADRGTDFYACPRHVDVQSTSPSVCAICGMKLVRMAPPAEPEFEVKLETTPTAVKPGEKVRLRFLVFHPKMSEQVRYFNLVHDMPYHLFVVSQDLNYFAHLHPTQQPDGSLTLETVLPAAGYYKLFSDFFPSAGTPQVIHQHLVTAGFQGDVFSSQAHLTPDRNFTKTLSGVRCELKIEPEEPASAKLENPVAGKPAVLRYRLVDEKTAQPIEDLQPYLGAWGHTLILSEDATDYLHSHPTAMLPEGVDRTLLTGGPEVSFQTFFPRPGRYRLWSQFKRRDEVMTVSFTIDVQRLH